MSPAITPRQYGGELDCDAVPGQYIHCAPSQAGQRRTGGRDGGRDRDSGSPTLVPRRSAAPLGALDSEGESVLSTSDEEEEEFHEVLPPRFFGLPAVVADAAPT